MSRRGASAKPQAFAADPADAADELRCTLLRLVRSGDAAGVTHWLAEAPFAAAAAAVDCRLAETESAAQLRKLGAASLVGRRVCRFYLLGRSDTRGAFYAGTVLGASPDNGGDGETSTAGMFRVSYSDGEEGDLDAEQLADCILPDPARLEHGWTMLHVAAVHGNADVAEALLRISTASLSAKANRITKLLATESASAAATLARGGGGGRAFAKSAGAAVSDDAALLTPLEVAEMRGHKDPALVQLLRARATSAPATAAKSAAFTRRPPCAFARCAGLATTAAAPMYCYYPPPPAEPGRAQGPFCVGCLAGWRKHFQPGHVIWPPPATGPADPSATTLEAALADAVRCGALPP